MPYMITLFIGTIIGSLLRFYAGPWRAEKWFVSIDVCTSDRCYGYGAAYVMSFALFVFFIVHALLMMTHSTQSAHRRFWVAKYFLLIAVWFACLWIPSEFFFDYYANVARFVSAIFLLLQIMILIDFSYEWNGSWVERGWNWGVLGMSVALLGGALTLLIFCFKWFNGDGCETNAFFLGFTIVLTTLGLIISATEWCEHGNLLSASVMTLYAWWLAYSAMASDPDGCNTANNGDTWQVIIGMLVAAVAICYASLNLSNSKSVFGEDDTEELDAVGASAGGDGDEEDARVVAERSLSADDWEAIRKRNLRFHLVMASASMYVAMLLTNWGFLGPRESSDDGYDLGHETVWIKIITQWTALILFLWTLVAPQILSDRDFS